MNDYIKEVVRDMCRKYIKNTLGVEYFIVDGELVEMLDAIWEFEDYIENLINFDEDEWDCNDIMCEITYFFQYEVKPVKDDMVDLIEKFEELKEVK